jgi:glycosyltransferase involved in cell wall biosynthesis
MPCGVLGCLVGGRRAHLAVAHSGDVHLLERLGAGAGRAAAGLLARRARVAFASAPLRERLVSLALVGDRDRLLARSAVVPMGIDVEDFRPRLPRALLPGSLAVAFIGRRSPIKGLSVLERAVSALPGVTLRVADGGVTGEDKRRLLEEVDVLVVPSLELGDGRTEGTPTVVFEGMAAGLPIVASRTGGIPDVVRDGVTGLLVPGGDAEELGRALVRLRDDLDLRARLGREAAMEAEGHDWARVGPTLAALL